ncbi:acyl-CoA dehydrogenase [Acidiferrimicrobium sp. IK]|uniref:acyl-CoA dehydrogenase n=1 Tax=Acidiferrimicrobium sp. IK TaxID=2871700 RepID=UPI0021CB4475|nr:acyl-CoA dehydrogenase [Acidiferrimicrobium sp. IK]MCU4186348.1 acyl-CoA dehydrogenase [Acidiferrimicrobium sp. IK]
MSIALHEDHRSLAEVARSFLEDRKALASARSTLEAPDDRLPPFWSELCSLGWTGLHLGEEVGGQGFGLAELAIVVEELGRVVAPGPFLPTVVAGAVIARAGDAAQQAALLPGLAAGTRVGAVGLAGSLSGSAGRLAGDAGLVLGAGVADLLLLRLGDDLVLVDADADGVTLRQAATVDPTRRLVALSVAGCAYDESRVLRGGAAIATRIGRALAAAEAAGGARACTEMAVAYAKVREQFGRPIGSFQAVKHHCADMLVDTELATSTAWDAARFEADDAAAALSAAVAASQALPAYRRCAEKNIQLHGGIGYTWEHDAHLYLRRAAALAAVFGADTTAPLDVEALSAAGTRADLGIDLPPEAERFRDQARAFSARYRALPAAERRGALIESGYLVPHWPRPWGRGASVVEQLVIEEELPDVEAPNLGIGTWVLLTLIQHGTPEQVDRWVRPSLDGDLRWCQLFSEPNAGSDAAAIQTRATRTDGGWLVNGQKVWTSGAMESNRGLATIRTDPAAPKHAGITTMAIDMHASGVEVRPLREITGETLFNEVFFDDVFVGDDDVVGPVNQGWTVARATLGNERVSIGGNKGGLDLFDVADLVALVEAVAPYDSGALRQVGVVVAEDRAMAALNLRQITRSIAGGPPGAEGNVTKLLSAEHAQRVAAVGMTIAGLGGVAGDQPRLAHSYLFSRCLTIAGGTSEVNRNVIAERLLGLPRERSGA